MNLCCTAKVEWDAGCLFLKILSTVSEGSSESELSTLSTMPLASSDKDDKSGTCAQKHAQKSVQLQVLGAVKTH